MIRLLFLFAALLTLAVGPGLAQNTLSGPTLGLFFDPQAQALRPIWGIAGSATAGQPIDIGFTPAAGVVSPLQDYALVVSSDNSISVVTFPPDGPMVQPIDGIPIAGTNAIPDRIIVSPSGRSAALYFKSSSAVAIVTHLPNAPQLGAPMDLSALPNAPDVFAITDDGSLLLAGVRENADGSPPQGELFLIAADGSVPRSIAVVQHASAVAFTGLSHDALLADDVAGSVTFLSDVANGANVSWAYTSQALAAPDSVQASLDGQMFFVGTSTNSAVAILDATGAKSITIECGCAPAEFHPLNAPLMYQITEPAKGLLWVLNADLSNTKMFFVPIFSETTQPANPTGGQR